MSLIALNQFMNDEEGEEGSDTSSPSAEALAFARKVTGTRNYRHDPKDGVYEVEDTGEEAHILGYAIAWASYERDDEATLRYVWEHERTITERLAHLLDEYAAHCRRIL